MWTFRTTTEIIPGAVCYVAAGPTIPTVTSSDPTSGNQSVTISTAGVAGGGKLITATFSMAMNPATINSATPGALSTFTLIDKAFPLIPVPGTVAMNTLPVGSQNRIATFTTSAALLPNTEYTATITTAARSAGGIAIACPYVWSFKTGPPPAAPTTGQAMINLGTAGTYGIFIVNNASLTLTGPETLINGDVGFMSDGAGSCVVYPGAVATITCAGAVPAVNGVVHNGDGPAIQAQIDFNAAYVDGAGRVTNKCELANGDLSAAQGSCVGFSPSTPGPIYGPGLYHFAPAFGWSSTITLDAQGDPDAVFIFQADNGFTTAPNSKVLLAGQAQAKNVFWIVGTAATLGTSSTFEGTIIVGGGGAAAITVNGGTSGSPTLVEGRLFSGAAATVGTYATITVPQ